MENVWVCVKKMTSRHKARNFQERFYWNSYQFNDKVLQLVCPMNNDN